MIEELRALKVCFHEITGNHLQIIPCLAYCIRNTIILTHAYNTTISYVTTASVERSPLVARFIHAQIFRYD